MNFKPGKITIGKTEINVTILGDPMNPALTTLTIGSDSISLNAAGQVVKAAPAVQPKRATPITKGPSFDRDLDDVPAGVDKK